METSARAQGALGILHCVLPTLILAYYFVAHLTTCLSLQSRSQRQDQKPVKLISLLQAIVLGLFAVEALLYGLLSNLRRSLLNRDIYALLSLCVWILLYATVYERPPTSPWYPVWGCWMLTIVAEIILLGAQLPLRDPQPIEIGMITLQTFRLTLVVLLLMLVLHKTKASLIANDEESTSLLRQRILASGKPAAPGPSKYGTMRRSSLNKFEKAEDKTPKKSEIKSNQSIGRFSKPRTWLETARHVQCLCCQHGIFSGRRTLLFAVGLFFMLCVERAILVLLPLQFGWLVDAVVEAVYHQSGSPTFPWQPFCLFVFYQFLAWPGVLSTCGSIFAAPIWIQAETRVTFAVRDKMNDLSWDFQSEKSTTDTLTLVKRAKGVLKLFISFATAIVPVIFDILIAFILLGSLFGGYISILLFLTGSISLWILAHAQPMALNLAQQSLALQQEETQQLSDSLVNWENTSYFGAQGEQRAQLEDVKDTASQVATDIQRFNLGISSLVGFSMKTCLAVAIAIVVYSSLHGTQRPGALAMVVVYFHTLAGQFQACPSVTDIWKNLVNAKLLYKLFCIQSSVLDGPHSFKLGRGEIFFENVNFCVGQKALLRNFTLRVEAGRLIAIVGETGAGKTTIGRLLFRLYDVQSGKIMIDGQDIQDVTLDSLRQHIGIVPQEVWLSDESLMENVRFGNPRATNEEVFKACKSAALHEQILGLPQGYATEIGHHGFKLSNGEKHKLAVARVFLRDPRILILDEAFAPMDSPSENAIHTILKRLAYGRTVIIMTNRISTIKNADSIVLVDDGNVLGHGSFQQLLEQGGSASKVLQDRLGLGNLSGHTATPEHNSAYGFGSGSGSKSKMNSSKHISERSDSSANRSFRANAPEFIPHYQRGTEASSGQPSHAHPNSGHHISHSRDASTHSHTHDPHSGPSEYMTKRDCLSPRPTPKTHQSAENAAKIQRAEEPRFDGSADQSSRHATTKLSRWQRRRHARSDPEPTVPDSSKGFHGFSPLKVRKGLRHVSGPGNLTSGALEPRANSPESIATVEDQQQGRARRQRHLRIKKFRDQAAARNNTQSDIVSKADTKVGVVHFVPEA